VAPVELDPVAPDLARFVGPGDGVVIGQCCAEPVPLVDALLTQASQLGPLRVFVGMTFRDAFATAPDALEVWSYGGLGRTRRIPGLRVLGCHFSALPRLFAARELPGDVALVCLSPPDAEGRCSFGPGPDYIADAVGSARRVIAEVNAWCPQTAGASVAYDELDAIMHTSRPLPEAPAAEPGPLEQAIAANVAALVRDGDTLQLGVGALPTAILGALRDHRDLRVHSGMVTDAVLDLDTAGTIVTGAALGSQRLFDALGAGFAMRPVSYTHAPGVLAGVGRLVAINSALEIDLAGRAACERAGGRLLGAVGGQLDFLRAAAANGGTPILALPAARVVEQLSGPVNTPAADVDWVATEHGARRLRGLDERDRAIALRELSPTKEYA